MTLIPSPTLSLVFLTSLGVGFSGAVSPGPLLAYTVSESLKRGFIAGPLVSFGHALLELLMVIGLTMGISRFLASDPVFAVIGFLGGLFLLWMGWNMVIRPAGYLPLGESPTGQGRLGGHPILGGMVVSLANPFWGVWWITIGLTYLLWARDLGIGGVASFYTGHIMSDLVWYSLVSFGVASGRRVVGPGFYRGLIVVCGLFLLALSGYFIFSAVDLVTG